MEIVEKVFQVIFVAVMSIGILGLPVYLLLNARKKHLNEEYLENKNKKHSDE